MSRTLNRRVAYLSIIGLALILLSGCHFSLLNRSSSLAAWSPDGTHLALCISNADTEQSELWVVNPTTANTRKLLSAAPAENLPHLLAPRWSPDGSRLHCLRTTEGEDGDRRPATIIGIDPLGGNSAEIGVIHYGGSRSTVFAESEVYAPLADSTLVAQDLGTDGIHRLVRFDPRTGERSTFAAPRGHWMTICVAPAGGMLAVAVPGPGSRGTLVTLHRPDGTPLPHQARLWADAEDDIQPSLSWSPTGDQLAIVAEDVPGEEDREEGFATLLLVDVSSGRTVTVADDVFGLPPLFSPDGGKLAFAASSGVRDGDDDLLLEVRVHDLAGQSACDVSLPGLALPLGWSADNTTLAYYLGLPDNDNRGSLVSVAANGTGTLVIGSPLQDRLAVPSPAGGHLAWVSGDGAVQIFDLGRGEPLFTGGLTSAGTIQAGTDRLRQGSPEETLHLLQRLDTQPLTGDRMADRAALAYTALRALGQTAEADAGLEQACRDLPEADQPAAAFITLCGALSDFGFRPEAERLVEEQLLARYPDSPEAQEALWALAALKQSEGDGEAALALLRRLLNNAPAERTEATRAVLLAALAESATDSRSVSELAELMMAELDAQGEDASMPARAAARYALAVTLEQRGRLVQARQAYGDVLTTRSRAILPDGRDVADLSRQALFRLALGDQDPETGR